METDDGPSLPGEEETALIASEQATLLFTRLCEGVAPGDKIMNEMNRAPIQVVSDLYQLLRGNNEGADLPSNNKKRQISTWLLAPPVHRPFVL